jgi:hypothetical protein
MLPQAPSSRLANLAGLCGLPLCRICNNTSINMQNKDLAVSSTLPQ